MFKVFGWKYEKKWQASFEEWGKLIHNNVHNCSAGFALHSCFFVLWRFHSNKTSLFQNNDESNFVENQNFVKDELSSFLVSNSFSTMMKFLFTIYKNKLVNLSEVLHKSENKQHDEKTSRTFMNKYYELICLILQN